MPLSVPVEQITPDRLDKVLSHGYRRSGAFFYRTQCPECSACEALRLNVDAFQPSRSQRRVEKKGDAQLDVCIGPAIVDDLRVHLFNKHRRARGLDQGGPPAGQDEYRSFLMNSPCETIEFSFWLQSKLLAIAITDLGQNSFSAVYCFFDPWASNYSPGTYAILKQLRFAKQLERDWLYLGLYVAENRHLNYKARYRPHQRLVDGRWRDFD